MEPSVLSLMIFFYCLIYLLASWMHALATSVFPYFLRGLQPAKNKRKHEQVSFSKQKQTWQVQMRERERERGGRESSLQSKHEGKTLAGSSPGSCKPMQVRRLLPHCMHQTGIHEPAAASDHFPSWIGSKGALLLVYIFRLPFISTTQRSRCFRSNRTTRSTEKTTIIKEKLVCVLGCYGVF